MIQPPTLAPVRYPPIEPTPQPEPINWGRVALWTIGVSAIAIAAAPIVMPIFSAEWALTASSAISYCGSGAATGLAGWSASVLSHVPLIGSTLAVGGITNALVAGGLALGGNYLAHKIDHAQGCNQTIPWGGIIRAVALATSFLVALPAIMPAITMGLTFISQVGYFDYGLSETSRNAISDFATNNFGKLGAQGVSASAGGAAASLSTLFMSHLVSCGVAMGVGMSALGHGAHHATAGHEDGNHCPDPNVDIKTIQRHALIMPQAPLSPRATV